MSLILSICTEEVQQVRKFFDILKVVLFGRARHLLR